MSYNDYEASQHDGSPIECYKFIGSLRTYLYTSSEKAETVNGEEYQPLTIRRQAIKAGTQEDDNLALEVELPYDAAVVRDYAYSDSPFKLTLEMYRVHRGTNFATDWSVIWRGDVTSFSVTGAVAKLRAPSIFARALQGDLPSAYTQTPCNHVLFDGRCGVSRAAFSTVTRVTGVSGPTFTVVNDGANDGVLVAGEAVVSRTGERRMILSNVENVIGVSFPFVDLREDDEVELTAGCDHSFETCRVKFNNTDRYGGHPYIPSDNPFEGRL